MTTLKTLQHHFQQFLLMTMPHIREEVATPQKGSATERLSVYGEGYYLRLFEALGIEFGALEKFMGHARFIKMARAYLEKHPSQFYCVRYIGTHLPSFLAEYDPARPYLRELALFEMALSNAIDARNASIKTTQDLAGIPIEAWGNMRFVLHPSVALLEFDWNIPVLWEMATKKTRHKPLHVPTQVTVWRKQLMPYYFAKEKNEARMLSQLQQGENFATICQSLTDFFPDETAAAQYAVNALTRWLNEEMISDIV
ncbi:MAG: putative DNA-binding domain-containing protein [Gammaproteobacteria bacterium]|nr:putative DNA-binding domain-containing protein [Gammaproteobacteria bacterium]